MDNEEGGPVKAIDMTNVIRKYRGLFVALS